MSFDIDFSEVTDLAASIEGADTKVRRNTRKAVEHALNLGKKAWRREVDSGGHLSRYPYSVDYDIEGVGTGNRGGEIVGEVGPNLGRAQGALGIVEDAPGGVNATPQKNYIIAADEMAEDLVKGLLIAVGDDGLGGS